MTKDVIFPDGFKLCAGDPFFINFYGMHHDPAQWQEPERFEPDRFNAQSKWFKRPNGEPRNQLVFTPFLGGKRVCLGKTFAEVVIRYTIPLIYYHVDFELLDPKQVRDGVSYMIGGKEIPAIPAKMTSIQPVK